MAWEVEHLHAAEMHAAARVSHLHRKIQNERPCVLWELLLFGNRMEHVGNLVRERETVAPQYFFVNCVAVAERNQHAANCPRACGGRC